jgi:hypothetical protein
VTTPALSPRTAPAAASAEQEANILPRQRTRSTTARPPLPNFPQRAQTASTLLRAASGSHTPDEASQTVRPTLRPLRTFIEDVLDEDNLYSAPPLLGSQRRSTPMRARSLYVPRDSEDDDEYDAYKPFDVLFDSIGKSAGSTRQIPVLGASPEVIRGDTRVPSSSCRKRAASSHFPRTVEGESVVFPSFDDENAKLPTPRDSALRLGAPFVPGIPHQAHAPTAPAEDAKDDSGPPSAPARLRTAAPRVRSIVEEEVEHIQSRIRARRDSEGGRFAEARARRAAQEVLRQAATKRAVEDADCMRMAWARYEAGWAALMSCPAAPASGTTTPKHESDGLAQQASGSLRFSSIPWPMNPPPSTPTDITAALVSAFVLSSAHSAELSRRERVRAALLRWHPDRFGRFLERVEQAERADVEGAVGIVARCLNELLVEGANNGLMVSSC